MEGENKKILSFLWFFYIKISIRAMLICNVPTSILIKGTSHINITRLYTHLKVKWKNEKNLCILLLLEAFCLKFLSMF